MFNKVISVILVILVAAGVALGAVNYIEQGKIKEKVDMVAEKYDEGEDKPQEDDIIIAGEYKIESTLPISEAYKSGDTSALSDREKETLDMAKAVLDKIITKEMTDFDKEAAVYKYLTKEMKFDSGLLTVIPTSGEDSGNPYGVLKTHTAVCVGYATTFRLLLQMMDIECMVVHSTDLTHSWDLIKLDGQWYHTDCYSDSETGDFANFNMNDAMCSQNHVWNTDFFPKAEGTKYNYAIMNKQVIENIFAIPQFISENADEENKGGFSCSFKEKIGKDDELTAKYIVETIMNTLNNTSEDSYYESLWTKDENGDYILCIFRRSFNGEENYDSIPEDVRESADEAIAEYFPDFENYGEDGTEKNIYYYTEAKG
ncbi:MAG: transglutaminase domain-containing protein [Clostridia bacterium]|nr:transglutaminase domain-containing protein [Clostridia bacterium]